MTADVQEYTFTPPVYDPDFKPPAWAAEIYAQIVANNPQRPEVVAAHQEMIRDIAQAKAQPAREIPIPEGSCPHAFWRSGSNIDRLIQCKSPEHCRVVDLTWGQARRLLDLLAQYTSVDIWDMIMTATAEQVGWALEDLDSAAAFRPIVTVDPTDPEHDLWGVTER